MSIDKPSALDLILKDLGSFVVAFSGGVDSSFLLYRAKSLNSPDVMAVTIRTPYIPSMEISEAVAFAKAHGIKHQVLDLDFPDAVKYNSLHRCYTCKKILFSEMVAFARKEGFKYVTDGTNADDSVDTRPGIKALREMNVRSPLAEVGLTKNEIRDLLKDAGLQIWDKPAMACLLTRIPYNTKITGEMLNMVEQAEYLLFEKGYPGARVRWHGDVARIECLPGYIDKILNDPGKQEIVSNLKKIGFRYITLDLEGYRTGSMDPDKK
jgi:uncharacterized protein